MFNRRSFGRTRRRARTDSCHLATAPESCSVCVCVLPIMQYAPQYAPQPVPQASSMVVSSSPYQTAGSTYTPYGAPAAAPSLDHTLGKWFAPGEALPPGFMAVPHPEGHIEPQAWYKEPWCWMWFHFLDHHESMSLMSCSRI